ncbi:MAG: glycosyltransferase family 2 protein [Nostoc sp. EfeVER01]|uniref:glycosyltransferase family 2 protein n=1 Tax=unclassified Nostoc TaxID=2593658 RepID=UPI002AD317D2|nr:MULTISPECIES: glycosyltransferase family 2 protein [unclassified Nostoc]MDZ7944253.1 glycosyltransferase family 2 protein [Nostoc sp. EfeVER01]MDZ7994955.1 glycosyltransferase family 2 protein [Nostoc sp. EspVER01]
MNLKFSVITPSFGQGCFIERTIQSVLSQQLADTEMEYVICDGASTDGTVEILKNYDKYIKWVSEPDKGQADAVNKGIAMTTGDIIAWINSDDIYYPGTFQAIKEIFESYPNIEAIYGDADHIDEQDRVIEAYPTEAWNYQRLIETCFLCQPSVFFRRSLVKKYGDLNDSLKYCMDYELWLRYAKNTPFHYIPRKLSGSRLYKTNKTLGQRIAVHYEINNMMHSKFGNVPDKWIFAYAHVKIEENWKLDRTKPLQNMIFVNAVIFNSLWSFYHWKKSISVNASVRMIWWLIAANIFLIKNLVLLLKRL